MNKRWYIIIAMVISDGLLSHYKSIFFGAPVREPNPIHAFFLNKFGISSLFFLIPAVLLIFWIAVKIGKLLILKLEKGWKEKDAENVILNCIILVYGIVVVIPLILMRAGNLFNFRMQWLPFKWLWVLVAVIAFLYSLYIDFIYKKRKK